MGDVIAGGAPEVLADRPQRRVDARLSPRCWLCRLVRIPANRRTSQRRHHRPVGRPVAAPRFVNGAPNFPSDGNGQFVRMLVFACVSGSLQEGCQ